MNTCISIFNEQQLKRSIDPLRFGTYKLEERLHELRECVIEIERIQNFWRHKRSTYDLLHCTPHDAGIWLKETPYRISTIMGYDILPAIAALTSEGFDIYTKLKIERDTHPAISSTILECDRLAMAIDDCPHWHKQSTNHIYTDLRNLTNESVNAIERILEALRN